MRDVLRYNSNFRFTIWEKQLDYYSNLKVINKILGAGNAYRDAKEDLIKDPHSLYVAVLVYGGIVGTILFIFASVQCFRRLFSVKKVELFYIFGLFAFSVYFMGVSIVAMSFTQCTWIPAFIYGYSSKTIGNQAKKEIGEK